MYLRSIYLFFVFFLLIRLQTQAENNITEPAKDSVKTCANKHRISIEPKIHYGFIMAHSPPILYLAQRHLAMYEFTVNFPTIGCKGWHRDYCNSLWGVSYLYSDLGNKKNLGGVHVLLGHFSFPLLQNKSTLFTFRLGTGAAWVEKPFNRVENFKNVAIGSHLNISMSGIFELRKKINERLGFTTGFGINHYSNGSAKVPNLGINVLSVTAGLTYRFVEVKNCKADSVKPFSRKWRMNIITDGGFRQTIPAGGRTYPAAVAMINISKQFSTKGKFGFGAEYQYSAALSKQVKGATDIASLSRIGINACYEQMIDRLAIVMIAGVYAYSKAKEDGPVYDRLGLRYYYKEHWIFNLSLKTHFANADFIDYGIGYQF